MQASRLCRITSSNPEAQPQPDSAKPSGQDSTTSIPKSRLEFEVDEEGGVDPIRMFAALPPPTLRSAQKNAVDMVLTIPKLVSVDREMKEIEIRIRRARKYKLKEEENKTKASHMLVDEDSPGVEQLLDGVRNTAIA
jgi:hypothetical protein